EEASADERGEDEGHCADGLDDRDRPEPEGDDVEHRDQAHEAETGDPGGAASEPGRQVATACLCRCARSARRRAAAVARTMAVMIMADTLRRKSVPAHDTKG